MALDLALPRRHGFAESKRKLKKATATCTSTRHVGSIRRITSSHTLPERVHICVLACMRECVRARERASERACVRARVRVDAYLCACLLACMCACVRACMRPCQRVQ